VFVELRGVESASGHLRVPHLAAQEFSEWAIRSCWKLGVRGVQFELKQASQTERFGRESGECRPVV
jgi:hypothetical protein